MHCVRAKPVGLLGDCCLEELHGLVGVVEGGREVDDFLAQAEDERAWTVAGGWVVRFDVVGAAAGGVLPVGATRLTSAGEFVLVGGGCRAVAAGSFGSLGRGGGRERNGSSWWEPQWVAAEVAVFDGAAMTVAEEALAYALAGLGQQACRGRCR